MPIFHKRPITSYPCCCNKYAATLESTPQKVLLQLASFYTFINFTRLQSYNVLSQQLFSTALNCPDFLLLPGVIMLISLLTISIKNCQIPDFFPFKIVLETTLPCASLKVAGHCIHCSCKLIVQV
jgi:hypothetical protein